MKTCPKCRESLDLKEFSPAPSRYDKVTSYCRKCARLRHYENREKALEGQKNYRVQNKEKEKARQLKWRVENKEHLIAYKKTNASILSERQKIRKRRPEDRYKFLVYQGKKRGVPVHISEQDYFQLLEKGECQYCGASIKNMVGHALDRIDSSGEYAINNVVLCCKKCNSIKRQYSITDLAEHLPKMLDNIKRLLK